MTKEIPLTRGQIALVDDEDYEYLNQWKWCAQYKYKCGNYYVVRAARKEEYIDGKGRLILMHRIILNAPKGIQVDHINMNTLDNRKQNLRLATSAENQRNRKIFVNNTSGYKGVHWKKQAHRWVATITVNNKDIHLGYFDTPEEAYEAYCKAAKYYHGKFARTE